MDDHHQHSTHAHSIQPPPIDSSGAHSAHLTQNLSHSQGQGYGHGQHHGHAHSQSHSHHGHGYGHSGPTHGQQHSHQHPHPHPHPRPLQIHLPQYLYTSAPTLVPGGGAEVVPLTSTEWFVNSGFTSGFSFVDGFGGGAGIGGEGFLGQPLSPAATTTTTDLNGQCHLDGTSLGKGKGTTATDSRTSSSSTSTSAPFDFADEDEQQQQQQGADAFPAASSSSHLPLPIPPLPAPLAALFPPTALIPPTAADLSLLSTAPSPFGLPVYSVSGFDILSILSRVHHRPNATVHLGPVDLTCSFVVVDPRRFDCPVVYCSPTFCALTGYTESEVLGRNCRFLQAPGGQVAQGEERRWTSGEAVRRMRKAVDKGEDVQVSVVNYKKGGGAFVNLVTVITVYDDGVGKAEGGKERAPLWHVGFQVDLTEQPNAILEKLRDGTYTPHFEPPPLPPPPPPPTTTTGANANNMGNMALVGAGRDRKAGPGAGGAGGLQKPVCMSKQLKRLLDDPGFAKGFPLSFLEGSATNTSLTGMTTTTMAGLGPASTTTIALDDAPLSLSATISQNVSQPATQLQSQSPAHQNNPLHLFLLASTPDFIHVVSLKGSLLYVAPSVKRVLGYDAREMVGKSLADYAHPEDVVPLMRELKESSAMGVGAGVLLGAGGMSALTGAGAGSVNGNSNNASAAVDVPSLLAAAAASAATSGLGSSVGAGGPMPRAVDLLFRAKTKMGRYVWVECRGRLHVEPGKGRKAIILTGRAREMMSLRWEDVHEAGGLARGGVSSSREEQEDGAGGVETTRDKAGREGEKELKEKEPKREVHQEVWGMLGGTTAETATFLTAGMGVCDVLGWRAEEVVGRAVREFVVGDEYEYGYDSAGAAAAAVAGSHACKEIGDIVSGMRVYQRELRRRQDRGKGKGKWSMERKGDSARWRKVRCLMRTRDGGVVDVWFVIYRADVEDEVAGESSPFSSTSTPQEERDGTQDDNEEDERGCSISPAALVYQIRRADAEMMGCKPGEVLSEAALLSGTATLSSSSSPSSSYSSNLGSTGSTPASASSMNLSSSSTPTLAKIPPGSLFSSLSHLASPFPPSSSSSSSSSSSPSDPSKPAPAQTQASASTSKDMFEELSTARGTSWQYELQQLRFSNARLEEEAGVLEVLVEERRRREGGAKDRDHRRRERKAEEEEGDGGYAHAGQHQQYQQKQGLFSRGQLVVSSLHLQHEQPPRDGDSYVPPASSHGGQYDALGATPSPSTTATLHQPKPQYSLGGRVPVPLPLPSQQRERDRDGLASALGYPSYSSTPRHPYPHPPASHLHQQHQHQHQHQHQEWYPLSRPRTRAQVQAQPPAQLQTQTWGTLAMAPLHVPMLMSMPPPSLMYHSSPSSSSSTSSAATRHSALHPPPPPTARTHVQQHHIQDQDMDGDGDVSTGMDMDMDMDVQAMYAAAAASGGVGTETAAAVGLGSGSGSGSGSSLKRPWSAIGS